MPIATKLDRMVTYLDKLLSITLHDPSIAWSCEIPWQPKIVRSQLPQYLWPPNLCKLVTCHGRKGGRLPPMLLHPLIIWSCEITRHISTTTISMATKLSRMVIYHDCRLHITSNDHIITWFCEIRWQTKKIVSPQPQFLRPQNVAGWWLTLSDVYP